MKFTDLAKQYPKTEDAALIHYWFGDELHTLQLIFLKGKEQELLDEAKRLEKEKNKNNNSEESS